MTKKIQNTRQITMAELKERIDAAIVIVDQENLCRLWTELEYWANVCRAVNKGHVDLYLILFLLLTANVYTDI